MIHSFDQLTTGVRTLIKRGISVVALLMLISALSSVCIAKEISGAAGEREISITARRYEFSPKTISVSRGERVRLVVTAEDVDHGFGIHEFGIEQEIKAKQTKAIELTADKVGRFEFVCAMSMRLGRNSGSFGFGVNARVRPTTSLLFENTPRVGFQMGKIVPDFDPVIGRLIGFKNDSEAEIAFGIERRIGRHVFSLTVSNTQATTTSRYNSSNQALPPSKFGIGFNLFRRIL